MVSREQHARWSAGVGWDTAARVGELSTRHEFLAQFVEAQLPQAVRPHLGASDVVQSVLLRVAAQADAFRGASEGEFRAWICRIARNRIADGLRRYRSHLRWLEAQRTALGGSDAAMVDEPPSRNLRVEEETDAIVDAILSLPAELREVVALRYTRGATFEQVAEALGMPVTNARRRWLEACQLLARRLGPLLA